MDSVNLRQEKGTQLLTHKLCEKAANPGTTSRLTRRKTGKVHPPELPKRRRRFSELFQRFRKGVGGRGLATNKPRKRAQKVLQKCVPILLRGHRKKGTEKRPKSLAFEGFLRANPLCPPTPFRNFSELLLWRCRVREWSFFFVWQVLCQTHCIDAHICSISKQWAIAWLDQFQMRSADIFEWSRS